MTQGERDPEALAFELRVRHDATVHRIQALRRMKKLRGSARTWWAVRELLRERREQRSERNEGLE